MSRISLRHLFHRVARRPATPRTTLNVELLEERRNPVSGVNATYNLVTGVLEVRGVTPPGGGFNPNDRIWVLRSGSGIGVFDARTGERFWIYDTKASIWGSP